jgi:hypothetical protein
MFIDTVTSTTGNVYLDKASKQIIFKDSFLQHLENKPIVKLGLQIDQTAIID